MSAPDRQTIFVVDDERDIRVALEDLLESRYRVLSFGEPAQALERLSNEPDVAVIISDQRMPQMPGHRFLAAARAVSDAEAILLTGYADIDAVIAAINDGNVAGYVHKPWSADALRSMIDVAAQRHRLRRELDLERQLFAGLVQGSGDAIDLIAPDGEILRSNRVAPHVLDDDDRSALRGVDLPVDERQQGDQWLRVQRIRLRDPRGRDLLLRIETDVSRERNFERRLRQAEKLQALGTLAGGIAHDFNNLLTAVIGNLELAVRKPEHPSVPRFVESALEAARRGASLTGRLLSFSRQRAVSSDYVDVSRLIGGMHDLLARTLGGGIEVVVSGCDPPLAVQADADQLELAVLNLCLNARDALAGCGTIHILCAPATLEDWGDGTPLPGAFVRIAVTDNGQGMSSATKARVFEPFFTTKPVGQGTGLGLAMVYGLATGLGGTVRVDSEEGRGTTVTMLLPAATAEPTSSSAQSGRPPAMSPLTILLVEDDAAVREVTRRTLEDMGHQVTVGATPEAARTILQTEAHHDLIITDYAMPGLSGLDLAAQARQRRPDLPVLLLTGFAEGAEIPADVHRLGKPFTPEGLARAISEAVAAA